jgi:hypothetical protein
MLKVKPKEINTPTGRTVYITKINVVFITNIPVQLERFNAHILYIEFVDNEGTTRDAFNANQQEFVDFLVTKGIERTEAETQIFTLFSHVLGGSDLERKTAISTMLSLYNYELDESESQPEPENQNQNTDEETA